MSQSTDENTAAEIRRARARERQQRKRARDRAKRAKSGQSGDEGPRDAAELAAEEIKKNRMRESARLRQQKHRRNLKARRLAAFDLPIEFPNGQGAPIEMEDRIDPALVAEGQNVSQIPAPPPSMFGNTLMLALTCSSGVKEALMRLYQLKNEDLPSLEATLSSAFDHWNQERLATIGRLEHPHLLPPGVQVGAHTGPPPIRSGFASTSSGPQRNLVPPNSHQPNAFPDTRYFEDPNVDGNLKRNGHSNGPSTIDPIYPEGPIDDPSSMGDETPNGAALAVYSRYTKHWEELIQAREKAVAKLFELPSETLNRTNRS